MPGGVGVAGFEVVVDSGMRRPVPQPEMLVKTIRNSMRQAMLLLAYLRL